MPTKSSSAEMRKQKIRRFCYKTDLAGIFAVKRLHLKHIPMKFGGFRTLFVTALPSLFFTLLIDKIPFPFYLFRSLVKNGSVLYMNIIYKGETFTNEPIQIYRNLK